MGATYLIVALSANAAIGYVAPLRVHTDAIMFREAVGFAAVHIQG